MVDKQILNKILQTKDYSIIEENFLTVDYFPDCTDEYKFISDHYDKYGEVPDRATFLGEFPDFDEFEVTDSNEYLLDAVKEEKLFLTLKGVMEKGAEHLQTNSNEALVYLKNQLKDIVPDMGIGGVDIISTAPERAEYRLDRRKNKDKYIITTGLPELDDILLGGLNRREELCVIFARTGQGKSWLSLKFALSAWLKGCRVGVISPEMTPLKMGLRFDTLKANFSNRDLNTGENRETDKEYQEYTEKLAKNKNPFIVSVPKDFNKRITVEKVRQWIVQYNLDYIVIDGVGYLVDERGSRSRDRKTEALGNISEDLMSLSVEMGIPVIIVTQSNREGVKEDGGLPTTDNIRDSDAIAHSASTIIALQNKNGILELGLLKNREGVMGNVLKYSWHIDEGAFIYFPSKNDGVSETIKKKTIKENEKQYNDLDDIVF